MGREDGRNMLRNIFYGKLKNQKNCFFVLLTMGFFFFSLSIYTYAEESEWYIMEETGMGIALPSTEYNIIFTRSIDEDDPQLSQIGATRDELLNMMETDNCYLYALGIDSFLKVNVVASDDSGIDFSLMDNEEILELQDAVYSTDDAMAEEEYSNIVMEVQVYQNEETKFLKVFYKVEEKESHEIIYLFEYITIHEGKTVLLQFASFSEETDILLDYQYENVLDSICFSLNDSVEMEKTDNQFVSGLSVYTDSETGLSFSIPANWSQKALFNDGYFMDVKFVSDFDPGLTILYGSVDGWKNLSAAEMDELGIYSREEMDNTAFRDGMAEAMGFAMDEIEVVSYAGNEYYKVEIVTHTEINGKEISVSMTDLIRVENGYIYLFQFSESGDNVHYSDFEELLESVHYPASDGGKSENGMEDDNGAGIDRETVSIGKDVSSGTGIDAGSHINPADSGSLTATYQASIWIGMVIGYLISGLIIFFFLQFLPICMYRIVKRSKVPHDKALKVSRNYALICVALMLFLSGWVQSFIFFITFVISIFIWAFLGYKVLKGWGVKAAPMAGAVISGESEVEENDGKNTKEIL